MFFNPVETWSRLERSGPLQRQRPVPESLASQTCLDSAGAYDPNKDEKRVAISCGISERDAREPRMNFLLKSFESYIQKSCLAHHRCSNLYDKNSSQALIAVLYTIVNRC